MKRTLILLAVAMTLSANAAQKQEANSKTLRPPSAPLLTSDPYFSVWSGSDELYKSSTTHWTGKKHPLIGAIRVDGKTYRFMGVEEPSFTHVAPTAALTKWDAQYTETQPAKGWTKLNFEAKGWKDGKADFSTRERKNFATLWESKDIWVRRTFELTEDVSAQPIYLEYSHDDIFELYINGVQVVKTGYSWKDNVLLELDGKTKKLLKKGANLIAAHCHNRVGGGYVDFGLLRKDDVGNNFDETAIQKSLTVMPTQTKYVFACGPVDLELTFTAPLLPHDLDLVSTPINYISYKATASDNKKHDIQIYFETTPELAVNETKQLVDFEKVVKNGYTYLKTGTLDQPTLEKTGDDLRIDWGYLYLASKLGKKESLVFGDYYDVKKSFASTGKLPKDPQPSSLSHNMLENMTVLAYANNLGKVSNEPATGYLMIGYDDIFSITYFHDNLLPYWKHDGEIDIFQVFERADRTYDDIMKRCEEFDQNLIQEATNAGGKEYAELCALVFRQAIAAHKLVKDKKGNLLFLSKENNSNGCINTVDITYPSAPLFLLYNPDLVKGMMNGILYYSESGRWIKPFPAHDLGTYPIANGQNYGEDMPVEEAGNMMILATAISYAEGNAEYARQHWDILTVWANYLLEKGLDPENQLCTDDFAGHLAHNTNLSIKAIMGIAGYGKMAGMLGYKEISEKYVGSAREMALAWTEMAGDGDHYRLTFDRPGTWSQKYNLVWDKVYHMDIFPKEVAGKEIAVYLTKQNKYGLPLDSRKTYTKSDWIMWTATMSGNADEFRQIVSPVYKYANETESRDPLSDWHETLDARRINFKARSVVGGYFMKMLHDRYNNLQQ